MVARREFLQATAFAGAGMGVAGCAGHNELVVAPAAALTALDMEGFLGRLDRSMNAIATGESPIPKLFPDKKLRMDNPVVKEGDKLLRKNMRSLLLVGSVHDLPEEGRAYPGVQSRLWNAMPEMDEAMLGTQKAMNDLTPTERADIGRALKEDPDLGMRIVGALDNDAATLGVPMERRLHLRSMAAHVCARLKQSSSLVIDEYTTKVQKIIDRPLTNEDFQRQMIAQLGEKGFFAMRDRQFAYAKRWTTDQGTSGGNWDNSGNLTDSPPPMIKSPQPTPLKQEDDSKPGMRAINVGAKLLGIGALTFLGGWILIFIGNPVTIVAGLGTATLGALLGIGGLITLIIGAIIRGATATGE